MVLVPLTVTALLLNVGARPRSTLSLSVPPHDERRRGCSGHLLSFIVPATQIGVELGKIPRPPRPAWWPAVW